MLKMKKTLYKILLSASLLCAGVWSSFAQADSDPVTYSIERFYASSCTGSPYSWRSKQYYAPGTFYDTAFVAGSTTEIETLYVLELKENPTYAFTERLGFPTFPQYYRGIEITEPGTYTAKYTTHLGCDSIYTIYVDKEIPRDEQTITVCEGETFIWRNVERTASGRYIEVDKDANGNVIAEYILNLTILSRRENHITEYICNGDSYTFGNLTLTKSGVYTQIFKDHGCDSIVVLSLNVYDADTITDFGVLLPDEPYIWARDNKSYTQEGTYYHISTNANGCIRTEVLILTKKQPDIITETVTVCPRDLPYIWHGMRLYDSGTYQRREEQPDGSFIWYRLELTVPEQKDSVVHFTVCENDVVIFNGKSYPDAGRFEDFVGCDTLAHIYITHLSPVEYVTNATISGGMGYPWHFKRNGEEIDSVFFKQGTYEYTSLNEESHCIDTWRLILTHKEMEYHFIQYATICEGDDFTWRGFTEMSTVPGTRSYFAKYKTVDDGDSIYELVLTVIPTERTMLTRYFCDEIEWKGKKYTESTIVYDTIALPSGCYEICRINFDKARSFHDVAYWDLIQGDSLHWRGQTIWGDGIFYDHYKTVYGCDSTYELHVTTIPAPPEANMVVLQTSICMGDTLVWRDREIWSEGRYVDTVPGVEKDSIYVLKLNVWPSYQDTIVQHLYTCGENAFIRYQGQDYYKDTILRVTLQTIHGCDSLVNVHMHFNTALYLSDTVKIPDTQLPYTWTYRLSGEVRDTVLTAAGTYLHSEPAEGSCYNREEIVLIVYPTYLYEDSITVCETQLPYHWLNGPIDHIADDLEHPVGLTKKYEYRYTTINNTDSIYRLLLTIVPAPSRVEQIFICEGDQVIIDDRLYVNLRSDSIYRDTVYRPNPDNECDSIIYYEIFQHPKYVTNIIDTICEHELPYILGRQNPDTIWGPTPDHMDNKYKHSETTVYGCDSIVNLTLTIIPSLSKNDSTFVCEDFFNEGNFIWLGDTVDPWFEHRENGNFSGLWQGKWFGVPFSEDTIVYNCDSTFFHHIIVRPSQKVPFDTTYYMCEGDSVQLFWPKTQWVKRDTVYFDTVPMGYDWTDTHHNISYHHQEYLCDSVVRWTVKFVHPEQKDTTAHIVVGDSIWWGGMWRYQPGVYDSIGPAKEKNSDSIPCQLTYTLNLIIDTIYHWRDTIDICVKKNTTQTYTWSDGYVQRFNVGAKDTVWRHYSDTLRTKATPNPHDSIYDLCVSYRIIRDTLIFDTICPGDSLAFDRHWFKVNDNKTEIQYLKDQGVYRDTMLAVNGCDSIITLYLSMRDRIPVHPVTVHLPDTMIPFQWLHEWTENGSPKDSTQFISAPGEYRFVMPSIHGCDSIDSLILYVHNTYKIQEEDIILCQNETPFTWQNRNDITTTGNYTFYTLTHDGYDSIRYVHIEVLPVIKNTVIYDTICEGDSLRFGLTRLQQPRFLTTGGIYYDTLTSHQYGCDSIIELRFNVYPKYNKHQIVDIADTQLPYEWKHIQGGTEIATELLNGTGEYVYRFTTGFGCDSIDSLSLRVHQTYNIKDDTIDICSDQTPYTWHTWTNITETGEYAFHTQTHDGYDSAHTVFINVWPVEYTTIHHSMCEGSMYIFGSKKVQLTTGGIYYDTLTSVHGCDSIVTLTLTVNEPYFNNRIEHIIEGNSVEFFGEEYSEAGTYTHFGQTPDGCDSTSVLQLFVHPLVDTTVVVCSNDLPYIWINKWNGQVTPLYAAGIYRNDTTYDAEGTRMFYGLKLIVNEPTDSIIVRSICADEQYDFNGQYLTEPGEYRDTLTNSVGCDSIIVLHLNVLPKYYNIIERTIYEGDTVIFQNNTYSSAGIYPVRYTSSFGCDSIIELRLTVARLYDDSVSICSNDLPYLWRGKEILESGIYRDTLMDGEGRPSVIGIKVMVLPTARLEEPIVKLICEGSEYKFGNRILTLPGTYYDTLAAANGCDSIVSLVLQVEPRKIQTDYKSIFEGDSVEFYGEWYKETGQYEHKEINALGCEDSHILVLTVLKASNVDTVAVTCKNELPFIWHGYEYYESGEFTLPLIWNDSARVTMTLHLTVNDIFFNEQNISLCEGDTIVYKNKQFFTNGIFYDTIPSLVGCDSVIKYVVSVHPTYDRIFEKHISDDSVYVWHDRPLTLTGMYEWTGKTGHGCDSIEHLILTVHPSFFKSDTVDLCQSDTINYPYTWIAEDGRIIASITETGVYNDSVLTEYGFDSIHQLVVFVHPAYLIREQYEIGEGEVLKIHGRDISQPAVYYDTLRTIHGCDSIFHVVVNLRRTREFTWTKEICQGEYYDFFGRKLTHTGKYVYTSQYKDSIVTLMLTVYPISITEERIVITDKQVPYIHDGRIYESSGVYADTMLNHLGCDSIHRLVLVVTSHYSEWTPLPLCPGSEIKIDGQVITEAGLYTFLRRSRVTGEMDSIYRVEVYDAPAYDMPTEVRTICDGDTVFIGGKAVTRAGHYDFTLKTHEGCDSLLHLDLTVNPSYHYYEDQTIRDFETFTWYDKTYSEEGNYDRTWPTILDCDSTYTLRLKVIPTQRYLTIDTICEGQSITWRGKEYNMSGYYTDTVYRKETFYSAIYTLQLTIMHPTFITHATINDICADDEYFDIAFTYTGAKPTQYSIYFDQLAKDEGFEDVINKPFLGEDRVARALVPVKTDVVYQDHTNYVKPNRYGMRLVLDNGVCGKSQSDSLIVLVKYPNWIIEQNWNDVVAPLKKDYNGGYEFSQISWYVNGTMQPNNGLGYMQNSQLQDGDEVVMMATRKGEKYAIPTCPLVIKINNNTAYDEPILVYPTKASRYAARVTIEAPQSGEYAVYSSMGESVGHGTFEQGQTQVTLPSINGIYIFRLKQGDKIESHKVIVY